MNEEIQTLLMSLRFEFGWVIGISSWVTILRIAFSFVNTKIREFAEQSLPAEREGIQKFLDSLPWRVLTFFVNMLTSIKLPTVARGGSGTAGNTTVFNKPPTP